MLEEVRLAQEFAGKAVRSRTPQEFEYQVFNSIALSMIAIAKKLNEETVEFSDENSTN
jgi:hypothetical protein